MGLLPNMSNELTKVRRILAVFPTTYGFGFVVFEGPLRLVDWGVKRIASKDHAENLAKIDACVEWFEPDTLVVENIAGGGSSKGKRVTRLIRTVVRRARKQRIHIEAFSRDRIRQAFSVVGAFTKHEIATVIAKDYEVLAPLLPSRRRIWMTEDQRMGVFDAAALALTHFHFEHVSRKSA